ncbi:hypothetical protein LZ31DRAFT_160490 [Colletotrichum somersetense]|nr:hypothetical protein LZ31DRAFT_160490 [Colletotrichum somersetense]
MMNSSIIPRRIAAKVIRANISKMHSVAVVLVCSASCLVTELDNVQSISSHGRTTSGTNQVMADGVSCFIRCHNQTVRTPTQPGIYIGHLNHFLDSSNIL